MSRYWTKLTAYDDITVDVRERAQINLKEVVSKVNFLPGNCLTPFSGLPTSFIS